MNLPYLLQSRKSISLFIFVVVCVTAISFFPSIQGEFLNWDDDTHLYNNPSVQFLDWRGVKEIFTEDVNKTYIPLTILSFAIEYHFFEDNPICYHITNLLLHLLNVFLIFLLSRELGLSNLGAMVASLIFGIHPIHVESVAWITERKDVLYSFFYLLSLLSYWKYLKVRDDQSASQKTNTLFLVLAIVLGVLSLLAKPMALSLPIIFLLMDWFKGRRIDARAMVEKIPLLLLTALIVWQTYSLNARMPKGDFLEGILIWVWSFSFYLKQFMFPIISVPIYRLVQPVSFLSQEYIVALLIFVFIVIMTVRYRQHKWFVFAVLYYICSIFFLLRFDDAMDINFVADRFMYLPSLGFCVLLGFFCDQLFFYSDKRKRIFRNAAGLIIVSLICVYSLKTYNQCKLWKNSLMLWSYQLSIFPNEVVALNNLATVLRDQENVKKAEDQYRKLVRLRAQGVDVRTLDFSAETIRTVQFVENLYKKAIELDSDYGEAYYNLGKLYAELGAGGKAVPFYYSSIKINPTFRDAYFNLGKLFLSIDKDREAIKTFKKLESLAPNNDRVLFSIINVYLIQSKKGKATDAINREVSRLFDQYNKTLLISGARSQSYFALGNLYFNKGDIHKALESYKKAVELNPKDVKSMYNLGSLYDDIRHYDDAINIYTTIIKIKPRFAEAYLGLGVTYSKLGQLNKALEVFEKARKLVPYSADVHFNLGFVHETQGKVQRALDHYNRAIKLNSKHLNAYYNSGNIYAALGMVDQAIKAYMSAIAIEPTHIDSLVNLSVLYYRGGEYKKSIQYFDDARIYGYNPPKEFEKALEDYR